MMDVAGLVEEDETPLTLNALIKAFHTALAPPPPIPAVTATTVPKDPGRDPGGDRKHVKNLQEGLRMQAVDIDRRFSQMADQIAHLAGSMERIEGLLRSASTATGTWSGSAGAGDSQAVPIHLKVEGFATDVVNRVTSLGSTPMVSKGCNVLDVTDRALVTEAARVDRPSDARARTPSLTLVVRPQKRGRSAWTFRSRELRGPVR